MILSLIDYYAPGNHRFSLMVLMPSLVAYSDLGDGIFFAIVIVKSVIVWPALWPGAIRKR